MGLCNRMPLEKQQVIQAAPVGANSSNSMAPGSGPARRRVGPECPPRAAPPSDGPHPRTPTNGVFPAHDVAAKSQRRPVDVRQRPVGMAFAQIAQNHVWLATLQRTPPPCFSVRQKIRAGEYSCGMPSATEIRLGLESSPNPVTRVLSVVGRAWPAITQKQLL